MGKKSTKMQPLDIWKTWELLWLITLYHPNYKQQAQKLFISGTRKLFVEEWTNKFYTLAMRFGIQRMKMWRFICNRHGLNPNLSSGLAASRLYTRTDLIQVAYKMKEEFIRKALMRALVARKIRSEKTIVGAWLDKLVDSNKKYTMW